MWAEWSFEAFPNGIIWGNTNQGRGCDVVLLGQVERPAIDLDAIDEWLQRPQYARPAVAGTSGLHVGSCLRRTRAGGPI